MLGHEQFSEKAVDCPSLGIPASQNHTTSSRISNITCLLTAIVLLELRVSNSWEHVLFWWRSVKPEFAQLTELSDNLITLFLWNTCKQQFLDICNWKELRRYATDGHVLCTGDTRCHIPDIKHGCARTPCIGVRNLVLGINVFLSVLLHSNNELTVWFFFLSGFFSL